MNKEKTLRAFKVYTEKNQFKLNEDNGHVSITIDGILSNEKQHGLKLCPCRLRDETRKTDLELICPCNFEAQQTWREQGRCWCGLFVKKQ